MSSESSPEAALEPKPKKGKLGLVVAIAAVVALVAGAAVAGTVLGPQIVGRSKKPDAAHAPEPAEAEAKVGDTIELSPILVDTRSADAALHHLKVVLAIELAETAQKEHFMKLVPRGREAAVAYLRSQPFESLAAPERYAAVRTELAQRFTTAVGAGQVARVMVVDFVAQ
jgi:flagellar basal body-associated protein FliL